ncbi:RNA polymerase sigma factor [Streptacidiphilus sp. EB103A]|uniref:RNA polymerase sigma factor n=1 Tax=Streptacidiphilus sp. EB103A TaxID=3156275 RepID=UPI003511B7F5
MGGEITGQERMRESFLDLVERDYRRVIRMLMLLGASQQDAQDAVQDAFLQGWNRVVNGDWNNVDSPGAWIRRIAIRSYHRPPGRARTQPLIAQGVDLPDHAEHVPGHAELTEQILWVVQLLDTLPADLRMVTALTMDKLTCTEIAQVMWLRPQQVLDLRKKARSALSQRLAVTGGKEDVR